MKRKISIKLKLIKASYSDCGIKRQLQFKLSRRSMSSFVSWKSQTLKFSSIRVSDADLGITIIPLSIWYLQQHKKYNR